MASEEDKQPRVIERAKQEFFDKPIATTILVVGAVLVAASVVWGARSFLLIYVFPGLYAAVFVFSVWFRTFKSRTKGKVTGELSLQVSAVLLMGLTFTYVREGKIRRDMIELMPQTEEVLNYEPPFELRHVQYLLALSVIMLWATVMPSVRRLIRRRRGLKDDDDADQPST